MAASEYGAYPDEKTKLIARSFVRAGIPYAFGGAIALFYVGEPRGTGDIDVNVFLPDKEAGRALDVLEALGATIPRAEALAEAERDGQVRLLWDATFVDLFFAYADLHKDVQARARTVDFAGESVRVISGEDLLLFKMMFGRPKDWQDIQFVVATQRERLDLPYIRAWLHALLGPEDGAVAHFEAIVVETLGAP